MDRMYKSKTSRLNRASFSWGLSAPFFGCLKSVGTCFGKFSRLKFENDPLSLVITSELQTRNLSLSWLSGAPFGQRINEAD